MLFHLKSENFVVFVRLVATKISKMGSLVFSLIAVSQSSGFLHLLLDFHVLHVIGHTRRNTLHNLGVTGSIPAAAASVLNLLNVASLIEMGLVDVK